MIQTSKFLLPLSIHISNFGCTWRYDIYHNYEEHVQYFKDLQAAIPNNSRIVSSGTSFEGRDIFGLHLWGDSGPNKTAILYHGTVHAREWITTPVCSLFSKALNLSTIGCGILRIPVDQRIKIWRQEYKSDYE